MSPTAPTAPTGGIGTGGGSGTSRTGPRAAYAWWGLCATGLLLILLGPELAPHGPTATPGPPYRPPAAGAPLGTDHLGRDVLSMVLHGGRPLLLTGLLAVGIGSVFGASAGLLTALAGARSRLPRMLLMRPLDALAAVPPVLLVLLILTALPGRVGLITAIALAGTPLSARVAYAAAEQVVGRAHVEAAIARGESRCRLLGREVLPLVAGALLADAGIRFTGAVYLVAAAGFLGVGGSSDADWGRLIVEALPGASLQPLALLAPVLAVALVAVTVNLAADSAGHRSRKVLA
ncbi:ABC transporter permease subunit [Streptomyces alkaliphilus]|uniref:ABC transporter permease subunit n=1 Tax=Streptomyces alkaliphilus TaxID=1472722 RepID=A0A7W3T9K6_9ACTN|nr:ABC transporter permease subunit [Streptomyces alkaliphilus]MBB0242570.1 ABC transporter permease subunit [Streptomyces alkaliphilus]